MKGKERVGKKVKKVQGDREKRTGKTDKNNMPRIND